MRVDKGGYRVELRGYGRRKIRDDVRKRHEMAKRVDGAV